MKSVLEFIMVGVCVVVITLLACWAWWELNHWWQMRAHRKYSSSQPRRNDLPE